MNKSQSIQNENTITRLQRYGCLAKIVRTQAGHHAIVVSTPVDKAQYAIAGAGRYFVSNDFSAATSSESDAARRHFKEVDPAAEPVSVGLDALARQGAAVAEINADTRLSAAGKLERIKDAWESTLKVVGTCQAKVEKLKAAHDAHWLRLYDPGQPDAAQAALDVETRAWFCELSPSGMLDLLAKQAPDDARLLIPLKRGMRPLSDAVTERINDAWMAYVARQKPEEAATLQIGLDTCEWAMQALKDIAAIVTNASMSGGGNGVSRFDAYRVLRPTGGTAVLNFTADEITQFERRLVQAA